MTIELLEARTRQLDLAGIDFAAFTTNPLDDRALKCLRSMHDIEFHTACYLRDILVTPAHLDPEVTAFLTFWAYEEYWHGHALGLVLDAHGADAGPAGVGQLRTSLGARDRLRPLAMQAASLIGDEIVAVQMAWGAVNERLTQAGYASLAATTRHPVLAELIGRITRQEGRHIAFYTDQARSRLERSKRARRFTRWALAHLWSPVGSGVLARDDVDFARRYLFGNESGEKALGRIDRCIDRLPGLDGLALMDRVR